MTVLYSLFEENWTNSIPIQTAAEICQQIKTYYKGKKIVHTNCLCHFCEGDIYNNGKNNRGCSLINHLHDKFHQNIL